MNKKPVLLRSLFALLVLCVFTFSMFPLGQRDYFDTLSSMMVNPNDPAYQAIIKNARAKVAKTNVYASSAVEEAAAEAEEAERIAGKAGAADQHNKILLRFVKQAIIKTQKLANNRDVIANARRLSAGSIRLGIDLNGGAEFLLELQPADQGGVDNERKLKDINDNYERYRDIAIENLRRRIEGLNIFESEISPAGGNFISLRVPTVSKEEKVKLANLIKMSARLSFNLVHKENASLVAEYLKDPKTFKVPSGYKMMHSVEGSAQRGDNIYFVRREAEMDGKNIVNAYANLTQFGKREILLSFNKEGAIRFGEVTTNNVHSQLAIILDGNLYSAPVIQTPITGGNAQITGDFSREDAENISNALVSGSVPFKVNIQAQYDIEPTIGKETVRDGLWSGIAGMLLVMVFILLYYRRAGIVADISLLVNAVLMLGAVSAFGVTLTLPGIAGIILTIGMAIDANVLIYERMREEVQAGKSVQSAIDLGFDKAFSSIFDSNITTLFVALILMWQGTGAIKGFAMTLAIGILTTLFTAVFLTHVLFDLMTRFCNVESLPMGQMFKFSKMINFPKYRWYAIGFSTLLIIISIATVVIRGRDAMGIDFTGGTQLEISYAETVPAEKIAGTLAKAGYDAKVTYKTPGSVGDTKRELEIVCRAGSKSSKAGVPTESIMTDVVNGLNKAYPKAQFKGVKQSTLGALIGDTFTKSAIISLSLAVLGMILYMTIRFQFAYSVAANVAVIHDIIIALGFFVLFGGEITLNTIAAALTILGYSINDTIVNFDRIRENLKIMKRCSYTEIINTSVNQTLSRTILTSLTTLMVLVMQLAFGGSGIRDFVAVMIIGVVIGWYSTIYIASFVINVWHNKTQSELTDKVEEVPNV